MGLEESHFDIRHHNLLQTFHIKEMEGKGGSEFF